MIKNGVKAIAEAANMLVNREQSILSWMLRFFLDQPKLSMRAA